MRPAFPRCAARNAVSRPGGGYAPGLVEHAFHHDRRERRRRTQAFLPGEQIGTQHVAGTRRQHTERGEADDRRTERGSEARRSDRVQQELPAIRAYDVSGDDGQESGDQQLRTGAPQLNPDVAEVRVPKEPREKGNRQN